MKKYESDFERHMDTSKTYKEIIENTYKKKEILRGLSVDYKKSIKSLNDCIEFISNESENIRNIHNEATLVSVLNYLKQYYNILNEEHLKTLPVLYKMKYNGDNNPDRIFEVLTRGKVYNIVYETEDEYVVIDNETLRFENKVFFRSI